MKQRITVTENGTTNYSGWKLVFPGATVSEVGGVVTVTVSGGGGSSNHTTLTHLGWTASGHTGTHDRIAGFDGAGAATFYTGSQVVGFAATTAGDLVYGDGVGGVSRLPIGSANRILSSSGTAPQWWTGADFRTAITDAYYAPIGRSIATTAPISGGGDLSADRTLTLSGWSGTTDGRLLYRNGTAVATATVSAPLTFTAGALAITQSDATHDGYLSSTDWTTFNSKQAGSSNLTGLAALGDGIPVRSTTWQTLGYSAGLSLSSTTLTLDSGLQSLTSADATAGLPYVTAANTWATATYTAMLSVVSGAWKVIGWRESGGQDLTNGAIADGQLVARVGTTLAGVDVSATPAASKVVKSGAGGTIDNGWLDADIKALGDNSTNGLWARTGSGTGSARTITAGPGVTITNGDGVSGNPTISASTSGGAGGGSSAVTLYGSARDGDVTFNGGAVTGWSLTGSTYTRTAANDPHYKTLTIAANYTLVTAGVRIRCRTLVMGNSSAITAPGGAASVNTAGTGSAPATVATSSTGACFYGSPAGAAGRTANSNGASAPAIPAGAFRGGGQGGTAAASGGRARYTNVSAIATSGSASTGTNASASTSWHYYGDPFDIVALTGVFRNGTSIAQIAGGGGGGGGAGTFLAGTGSSGGGGGGGGVCVVFAGSASFGTSCTISAPGGNGGTANTGSADSALAGGHGGGGGLLVCVLGEITGSNLPSFSANGGNGGGATVSGTGQWAEGGNGGNGGNLFVYVGTNSVGGTPTYTANGGTKGADAGSGTGFVGALNGSNSTNVYYNEGT